MNFCLNIQNGDYRIVFRLQQDLRWAPCVDRTVIGPNDLVVNTLEAIIALQKTNVVFTIGEEEYICNPSIDVATVGFVDELSYAIYAFADTYPAPPSREQLRQALRKRLPTDHFLFLDREAQFQLVPLSDWQHDKRHQEGHVCRLGFFNGRSRWSFGRKAEHIDTDYLFQVALNAWRNYVRHKELNDDIELYGAEFGRPLEEPAVVVAELGEGRL